MKKIFENKLMILFVYVKAKFRKIWANFWKLKLSGLHTILAPFKRLILKILKFNVCPLFLTLLRKLIQRLLKKLFPMLLNIISN